MTAVPTVLMRSSCSSNTARFASQVTYALYRVVLQHGRPRCSVGSSRVIQSTTGVVVFSRAVPSRNYLQPDGWTATSLAD